MSKRHHGQRKQSDTGQNARQSNETPPSVKGVSADNPDQPEGKVVAEKIRDKNKIALNWRRNADWWMVIFTGSAVLFAGISAVLLYRQLDDAHRNFVVDERAWIKVNSSTPQATEGAPVTISITFTNTGKTPAKNVDSQFLIEVLPREQMADLSHYPSGNAIVRISTGLLVPGDTTAQWPAVFFTGIGADVHPKLLNHNDYMRLVNGADYVVLRDIVTFDDIFGVSHWVHYCKWETLGHGEYPAKNCTAYNGTDNN
jgi:hypothetical protein